MAKEDSKRTGPEEKEDDANMKDQKSKNRDFEGYRGVRDYFEREIWFFYPEMLQGDFTLTRDSFWKRLEALGISEERKLAAFPELALSTAPRETLIFHKSELFERLWNLGFLEKDLHKLFRDMILEGEDLEHYRNMLQEYFDEKFPK